MINVLIKKFIYFIIQSDSINCNKLLKFTSWSNMLEGHHILSPEMWSKTFTYCFKKCSDGYISSIWYKFPYQFLSLHKPCIHRMGNAPNILYPIYKEQEESNSYFVLCCELFKTSLGLSELINLNYSFNIPFKINLKNPLGAFFSISRWYTVKNSTGHIFRNISQAYFLLLQASFSSWRIW